MLLSARNHTLSSFGPVNPFSFVLQNCGCAFWILSVITEGCNSQGVPNSITKQERKIHALRSWFRRMWAGESHRNQSDLSCMGKHSITG